MKIQIAHLKKSWFLGEWTNSFYLTPFVSIWDFKGKNFLNYIKNEYKNKRVHLLLHAKNQWR